MIHKRNLEMIDKISKAYLKSRNYVSRNEWRLSEVERMEEKLDSDGFVAYQAFKEIENVIAFLEHIHLIDFVMEYVRKNPVENNKK